MDAAIRHQVPAALIVSHSNNRVASKARKEVQVAMIDKLGMSRRWCAFMFGRDVRRVRASELGQRVDRRYCRKTGKFAHFKDILVTIDQQVVWIETIKSDDGLTIGRRKRQRTAPGQPSNRVQLVLGFLSWRDCTTGQMMRRRG
jgi:hypothetical protein